MGHALRGGIQHGQLQVLGKSGSWGQSLDNSEAIEPWVPTLGILRVGGLWAQCPWGGLISILRVIWGFLTTQALP